jgi:hypothetical protein
MHGRMSYLSKTNQRPSGLRIAPPEKRAVLENYMAERAFCRRELAALKELGPILDRLEVPEPLVGLVVWIMAEQPGSVSGPHP